MEPPRLFRPAPVVAAPPAVAPAYSYAATMQPPPHLIYGGFWIRFVAYFLDSLIVGAVLVVIDFIGGDFLRIF